MAAAAVPAACAPDAPSAGPGDAGDGSAQDGNAADAEPARCPSTQPVVVADIGLTWVAPGPAREVCTQADLDALRTVFGSGSGAATYADIEKVLSFACRPCVFTNVVGPRWGMIIKDGAKIVADNTLGACFGVLSTPECGEMRFQIDACLDIACPQAACGTNTESCNTKALVGACKSFLDRYAAACPDERTLLEQCGNFLRTTEVTCGGGADAGLDSSL